MSVSQLIHTYGSAEQAVRVLQQQTLDLQSQLQQQVKVNELLHQAEDSNARLQKKLAHATRKIDRLYKQLDKANASIISRNGRIKEQEQKLIDYALEIDDLYNEKEYFKTQYEQAFIERDRDLALTSLHDTH